MRIEVSTSEVPKKHLIAEDKALEYVMAVGLATTKIFNGGTLSVDEVINLDKLLENICA